MQRDVFSSDWHLNSHGIVHTVKGHIRVADRHVRPLCRGDSIKIQNGSAGENILM